jgi:potassium efflux system protein
MAQRAPLALLAVVFAALSVAASEPRDADSAPATVESRLAEIDTSIAALEGAPEGSADAARLSQLRRLQRVLSRQLEEQRRAEELRTALEEARAAQARDPGEGLEPPFGLRDYDAALAAVQAAETAAAGARATARDAVAALEAARESQEQTRKELRAAQADGSAGDGDALRVEIADATLELRRLQAANARLSSEHGDLDVELRQRRFEWIVPRVEPGEAELDALLAELDRDLAGLVTERDRAELAVGAARRRWEDLRSRLGDEATEESSAELRARRAEMAARERELGVLSARIDQLERARELVGRRARVLDARAPTPPALDEWIEQSRQAAANLERELRTARAEADTLAGELSALESAPAEGASAAWRQRQLRALRQAGEAQQARLANLEQALERERRLVLAGEERQGSLRLGDQLRTLARKAADLWDFEVTTSEDRSITVGKIVAALLTFFVGLLLARLMTRLLGERLFPRVGMDEGAANAYRSLLYYALLGVVFVTALRAVNIPLTAFTVIGGALAIGVGFGSQNVVNNFISGLILLAERPIKVGDLVDVDGTYGNVERIGLRSTRIRTGDNIHVIVPNAAFLENKVVNWTHHDRQVRIMVGVGVVYGSPTREVERLVRKALAEHPRVLDRPEPIVLFTGFGDNSLDFEAHFWVRLGNYMERRRIESELRFAIDELFREAGIVIAFPQRDVHLDAAAPVPIVLMDGSRPPEEGR